jgi:hypothetical protein
VITTTPIAGWTWQREAQLEDKISDCIGESLRAYQLLAARRLVLDSPDVVLTVRRWGAGNVYLFRGRLPMPSGDRAVGAQRLASEVRSHLALGRMGAVDAHIACAGEWLVGGERVRESHMFNVGCNATSTSLVLRLATFSDAWMTHDLKGREQSEIFRLNSPRLAATLQEISEFMDEETVPGDDTIFGMPTETGVSAYVQSDGTAPDVWWREVQHRKEPFTTHPFSGKPAFHRVADGPVQYLTVTGRGGHTLGYLWASDAEEAASFEPSEDVLDEAVAVGFHWLEKLDEAKARGLPPSAALALLASEPSDAE